MEYTSDTPRGLKPHGFSGYARPHGPGERLKAVPAPTRTLHASPGERGSINSGSSAWHLVQDAFVLLPVGTTHHGTPKYDSYHLLLGSCRMGAWQDAFISDLT